MSDGTARPQHLFIVRMWHESSRETPGQWRGFVEHVPSAQRLYFAALRDVTDFITLRLSSGVEQSMTQFNREDQDS